MDSEDAEAPPDAPDEADEEGGQQQLEKADQHSLARDGALAAAALVEDCSEAGEHDVEDEEDDRTE